MALLSFLIYVAYLVLRAWDYASKAERKRDANDAEDAWIAMHLDFGLEIGFICDDKFTRETVTRAVELLNTWLWVRRAATAARGLSSRGVRVPSCQRDQEDAGKADHWAHYDEA